MRESATGNLFWRGATVSIVAATVLWGIALPAGAATETVVHAFTKRRGDGAYPVAGLIDIKGILYGTTQNGGAKNCPFRGDDGCGTVFSINPKTGAATVLHAFTGGSDGLYPQARLTNVDGTLYGTTSAGGGGDCFQLACGTVFSIAPDGTERVVYAFKGGNVGDGADPQAGLTDVKGTLYGTTAVGGASSWGTVFSIAPNGTETVVYSFMGPGKSDGSYAQADLIYDKGELYGTTSGGGAYNDGIVFAIGPGGTETILHAFNGSLDADGTNPMAGLVAVSGTLYGTTADGGLDSVNGTVFSVTRRGREKIVFSFAKADSQPDAGLIDVNGMLYGTTAYGTSTHGGGSVFSVDPANGHEYVLYEFCASANCTDGADPEAKLIDVDGTLYGTTKSGGTYEFGTVFSIKP